MQDMQDPDRLCRTERVPFIPDAPEAVPVPGSDPGSCDYGYDALGNVTSINTADDPPRSFSYDALSRVSGMSRGATKVKLRYDAFGNRSDLVLEDAAGTRNYRQYGPFMAELEHVGSDLPSMIELRLPGPLGRVADRRGSAGTVVYHHGDQNGNRFFTNQRGDIVQQVGYRTYGEIYSEVGSDEAETYTRFLWNGGESIKKVGVTLLGDRMYDPVIGRFLQRDPLVISRQASQTNPYAFARGDPVNLADPNGLDAGCDPLAAGCRANPPPILGFDPLFWDWGSAAPGQGGRPPGLPHFDPSPPAGAEHEARPLLIGIMAAAADLAAAIAEAQSAWNKQMSEMFAEEGVDWSAFSFEGVNAAAGELYFSQSMGSSALDVIYDVRSGSIEMHERSYGHGDMMFALPVGRVLAPAWRGVRSLSGRLAARLGAAGERNRIFGSAGRVLGMGGPEARFGRGILNKGRVRLGWTVKEGAALLALHGGAKGAQTLWHVYLNALMRVHGPAPIWAVAAVRGGQVLLPAGTSAAAGYGGYRLRLAIFGDDDE
jgi:RHS repeat-associated protein